jgi:hypothetical protein
MERQDSDLDTCDPIPIDEAFSTLQCHLDPEGGMKQSDEIVFERLGRLSNVDRTGCFLDQEI